MVYVPYYGQCRMYSINRSAAFSVHSRVLLHTSVNRTLIMEGTLGKPGIEKPHDPQNPKGKTPLS